jgi:ketosteroid isomerase-like protein
MDEAEEVREAIEGLFDAILRRNIDAIQQRYLQEDRLFIFLEGWEGKIEGFDRKTNGALWQGLFDQVTFSKVELTEDVQSGRTGDLGWVGGTTSSTYTPAGGTEPVEVTQRATWILERHLAKWLIVFEHVSFPKDKPYGAEELIA